MNVNDAINLLVKELESWVEIAVKAIPNVILALLVFFGFWLLAKYIRIGTRKLMRRVNSNRAVDGLIENFVYFLVLCLGLFLALGILNLDKTLTSLLAGAGVIGLADNVLRPILVGRDTKLPDYIVLLSTLGGFSLFGMNGFVLGPLIAALFMAFWEIFIREFNTMETESVHQHLKLAEEKSIDNKDK